MLAGIRHFFGTRGVLEVETPMLSAAASVDLHVASLTAGSRQLGCRYLHTSPEFPMKRLLAAGAGPIYQVCRVFRDDEAGRHHQPEFTLLEWYRPGFDHHRLMDEVEALLLHVLPEPEAAVPVSRVSYRDAVRNAAGVDPFTGSLDELRHALQAHAVALPQNLLPQEATNRDFWLDLVMSTLVGPGLGLERACFIYDYPASQAALARVRAGSPELAERFELYWQGVELANGFHELTDAAEQSRRFAADLAAREALGRPMLPADSHLIRALEAGLPDCAGVALGVDRLLMLALGLPSVAETLAFPADRA
jgi:lysyl-tRNA synthetase class 2